jgi:hypothetical protein
MGTLISDLSKTTTKSNYGSYAHDLAMIENIKKTTKEHLFEKKYNKMAKRLKDIEDSMKPKDTDYDQEVNLCFQSLCRRTNSEVTMSKVKFYTEAMSDTQEHLKDVKGDILRQYMGSQLRKDKKQRCKTLKLED